MRTWVLILCGVLLSACDGSPTTPDPRLPPTTGTPSRLQVIDWRFSGAQTTARAEATWGSLYSTTLDVTTDAEWRSSASAVVQVAGPGRLVAGTPGDANVTVTFRDVSVNSHVRVYDGEPPLLVLGPDRTTEVSAFIRDASGVGVEGATVEIIGGHNAGRSTTTLAGGRYSFLPPFVCGAITMRASKAGYRDASGASTMCMDGLPRLTLDAQ